MNFLDLYKKIKQLDEGLSQGNMMPQATSAAPSQPTLGECGGMGECGGDMPMPAHQEASKQQDSVSMNVSMNASGAGGIRNLMNILKNIDDLADNPEPTMHHEPEDDDEIVVGEPEVLDSIEPVTFEEPQFEIPAEEISSEEFEVPVEEEGNDDIANRLDPKTLAVSAVIGMGDDLASKGKEAPKQAGGGNPWNVNESTLAAKLLKHYNEVKTRKINESSDVKYGYGDEETWGGQYPSGQGPRRRSKDNDAEPDDYRAPGTGSQQDIEGDILDKWHKGFEKFQKEVKTDFVDQEGEAPNGKRYNKLYVIDAPNQVGAMRAESSFERHHWGAKDISDKVTKRDEHGRYLVILYIVDNHKYGQWKPFKDSVPKKPISFSR